jgi:hypothetical protein
MSFEMMLSQMPNLQQKFFICPMNENETEVADQDEEAW